MVDLMKKMSIGNCIPLWLQPFLSVKNCTEFVKGLNEFVISLKTFLTSFVGIVNSAIADINSLDKEKFGLNLCDCKEKLESARNCATTCVTRVKNMLRYACLDQRKVDSIKASYRNGDYEFLNVYIGQIRKYLDQIQQSYNRFSDKLNIARESCRSVTEKCNTMKVEARNRSIVTGVVGSAIAGVSLISGTVASIVTGIFTFGITTAVTLAIAIPSTAVVTTGVAGTTAAIVINFESLEVKFNTIGLKMDSLNTEVSNLQSKMDKMKEMLAPMEDDIDNVHDATLNAEYDSFCCVFDILIDGIRNSQQEMFLVCLSNDD